MVFRLLLPCAPALLAAACAPAPLYTAAMTRQGVTTGEIPRDGRGEPVWSAIPPAAGSAAPAAPPARSAEGAAAARLARLD